MMLRFSAKPGFWERHMQRKAANPRLFCLASTPQQADVTAAWQRDQQELARFHSDFKQLLEDMAALQGAVDTQVILQLKERIDRLYIHAKGDANLESQAQALLKLHAVVMTAVIRASANDPLAREEVEQEQAAHAMHLHLLEHPLTAHLLRADSPIAGDELLPTLLSETPAALRAVLGMFDATQLAALCDAARRLLDSIHPHGEDVSRAEERLALMRGVAHVVGATQTLQ
jgi:tRNA-dihydrouridine synthase